MTTTKYPVGEALKDNILLSGANTLTENEYLIPTIESRLAIAGRNKSTKAIMIDEVVLEFGVDWDAIADGDEFVFQITSSEEGAEVDIDDKDCIFKYKYVWQRDFTTSGLHIEKIPMVVRIPVKPPIPYIKSKMWIAAATVGQANAMDLKFEIRHHYQFISSAVINRLVSQVI